MVDQQFDQALWIDYQEDMVDPVGHSDFEHVRRAFFREEKGILHHYA